MIIGIIGGTGKQGSALAKRWVSAGYEIYIGSRSKDRGYDVAKKLNVEVSSNLISGGDNAYACSADVIVLAIPFQGIEELLNPIVNLMANKIVIDLTVNLKPGKFFKVLKHNNLSSYEFIREFLSDSRIVACMKTISSSILESDDPINEFDFQISTDDDAIAVSFELAQAIGLNPVRVRGKFHAHTLERMVALAIQLNKEYPGSHIGYLLSNFSKN